MGAPIERALDAAVEGMAAVFRDVRAASALAPSSPLDLRTRAISYVWTAAVLEKFMKDLCAGLLEEINATAISQSDLRLTLFPLLFPPEVDRIRSAKKIASLSSLATLLSEVSTPSTTPFLTATHPLDGRTIRTQHVEVTWLLFGISTPCWPSLAHRLALEEVADRRNDVAHANADPLTIGRRRGTSDLCRLLGLIEDLVLHLWTGADDYLSSGGYRR